MHHQADLGHLRFRGLRVRGLPMVALFITMAIAALGLVWGGSAQESREYGPASGDARVIAQGVVELPAGDVSWRVVRASAEPIAGAGFAERQLGFVLAVTDAVLLVEETTGEQVRLGASEAALARSGAVQLRASPGEAPASYLAIELVAADAPAPPAAAAVLYQGEPFVAPAGPRDLDLVSDGLRVDETLAIPDTGAMNLLLVTAGAVELAAPTTVPIVLLAGEAAEFSGEALVAVATGDGTSSDAAGASVVVAMIGPEVPPVMPEDAPTTEAAGDVATEAVPAVVAGQGSISLQVFACPRGMSAETLDPAACAPIAGGFDVSITGASLAAPLTEGAGTAVIYNREATLSAASFFDVGVDSAQHGRPLPNPTPLPPFVDSR
jgi:hypothetical protein